MSAAPPMRMGLVGCSAFALRAMAPLLKAEHGFRLVAVASREAAKARAAASTLGCEAVAGYDRLLERTDLDAVYIPLPAGLHEEWVVRALGRGLHVLCEKPFAVGSASAERMVGAARQAGRLVVENVLFPHHRLLESVRAKLESGILGEPRLFRSTFTIPRLPAGDIRYQARLGGGALNDLGTYMVKFARVFLGEDYRVAGATAFSNQGGEVDLGGLVHLRGADGIRAQLAYAFDVQYQNNWEFLGSRGRLLVERAYTPPPDFTPVLRLEIGAERREEIVPADSQYRNMLVYFREEAQCPDRYEIHCREILRQAQAMEALRQAVAAGTAKDKP